MWARTWCSVGLMETKDKIQICKVVAAAIMSDAKLTDKEMEFLGKLMDRYELDKDQRREVMGRNADDDPEAMVQEITGMESKDELMGELLEAIAVDGEVSKSEKRLVTKVGRGLGMSDEEISLVLEED